MLYPQMNAARSVIDLNGFWNFLKDENKTGESASWFKGLPEYREIAVPASWNEQYLDLYNFHGIVWYEKKITLPQSLNAGRIFLRFGSIFYSAQVWVNGEYCGEHTGGHLPFEFPVETLLQVGKENSIVVRVDAEVRVERLPAATTNPEDFTKGGGYLDQVPPVNYDFFPYGGIHRPVYLYTTATTRIEDIAITSALEGTAATVNYQVRLSQKTKGKIQIVTGDQTEEHDISTGAEIKGSVRIENPQLWDTTNPYLYNLQVKIHDDKGLLLDEYNQTYGIREIKIENGKLLLNGKPIFLKGFGKHEDFPVIGKGLIPSLIIKDFDLLKWIGANSVRTSHYPYAEEFMDFADRHGLLIIDETPFVGLTYRSYHRPILNQAKIVIEELITRDKNHPSVIMWSLANEPIVDSENGENFFKEMYDHAKSLDNTRPITYVAFMEPETNLGMKYYDVICLNKYFGWYDIPAQLDLAVEGLKKNLAMYYEKFQKPIFLTEFGADAVEGQHSIEGLMFSEEYQSDFIEQYYNFLLTLDYCIGAHVWAFADFRTAQSIKRVINNRKGVFTRDRQPKLAAHTLRRLWRE